MGKPGDGPMARPVHAKPFPHNAARTQGTQAGARGNTESPPVLVNTLASTGTNLCRKLSWKLPTHHFCPLVFLQPLETHGINLTLLSYSQSHSPSAHFQRFLSSKPACLLGGQLKIQLRPWHHSGNSQVGCATRVCCSQFCTAPDGAWPRRTQTPPSTARAHRLETRAGFWNYGPLRCKGMARVSCPSTWPQGRPPTLTLPPQWADTIS